MLCYQRPHLGNIFDVYQTPSRPSKFGPFGKPRSNSQSHGIVTVGRGEGLTCPALTVGDHHQIQPWPETNAHSSKAGLQGWQYPIMASSPLAEQPASQPASPVVLRGTENTIRPVAPASVVALLVDNAPEPVPADKVRRYQSR